MRPKLSRVNKKKVLLKIQGMGQKTKLMHATTDVVEDLLTVAS